MQLTGQSCWEVHALGSGYDAIVIGGGFVGCGAALALAKGLPGGRILLLEGTWGPQNASSRNAGFACFGSVGELLADVAATGVPAVKQRIQQRWEGLQLLLETLGPAAIDYQPVGGNELFTDAAAFETAAAALPEINEWLQAITGEQAVYTPGTHAGYSVIHNRLEGALHSGKAVAALHRKLQQAGVQVAYGAVAAGVEPGSVHLAAGPVLQSGCIVVAAGARTGQLLPETGITPGRGTILQSQPLPGHNWQGTWHYDRGYTYWRAVGDTVLLGGGRNHFAEQERTYSTEANPAVIDWLERFGREVLHLPAGWYSGQHWSGTLSYTPDHLPVGGEVRPGIWAAAGMNGMGVAIGLGWGQRVAQEMLWKS